MVNEKVICLHLDNIRNLTEMYKCVSILVMAWPALASYYVQIAIYY